MQGYCRNIGKAVFRGAGKFSTFVSFLLYIFTNNFTYFFLKNNILQTSQLPSASFSNIFAIIGGVYKHLFEFAIRLN
tara:strand:- start:469 stop:699 length:231 start_codon:yes stop_codon:yes gene_type:complete